MATYKKYFKTNSLLSKDSKLLIIEELTWILPHPEKSRAGGGGGKVTGSIKPSNFASSIEYVQIINVRFNILKGLEFRIHKLTLRGGGPRASFTHQKIFSSHS